MRIKKTASFNVKEGVKSVRYSDLNSGIQYLPADGIINIKSEKVRIAGFGVNESSLYKIDVNGTPYSIGSANSIYLSNTGIITSKSIGGSKGTLSWAMAISDKFGVTVDGTLYAMGGHFAGTIEAKSGKIGTTLINEDGSIVSANGGFRLDANGDLTISHVGGSQLVQDAQTALSTANTAFNKAEDNKYYRVIEAAAHSSDYPGTGFWFKINGKPGSMSVSRGLNVISINPVSLVVEGAWGFDTYAGGNNNTNFNNKIAELNKGDHIIVVLSYDASYPKNVADSLRSIGGTVYSSSKDPYRESYALIGRSNLGFGNGVERYNPNPARKGWQAIVSCRVSENGALMSFNSGSLGEYAQDVQIRVGEIEKWKNNNQVDDKLNHAYDIVNHWAQNALDKNTTINGGLIQTNTITADKIAIGDFTNIFQMNKDNCGKYGFDFGSSATSGVYYVAHVQRDHHMGEFVSCKGGEQYYISADIYSSCHSNDGTWYPIGVGIHTVDVAHKNPSWVCLYAYPTNDNRRVHVEGTVTASRDAGLVRAFFQINDNNHPLSNGYEGDNIWISNCEIRKMNAGELIVDGTITGDKLAVNCVSNSNFKDENYGTSSSWINLKRGTMNLGGKLTWDGTTLRIGNNTPDSLEKKISDAKNAGDNAQSSFDNWKNNNQVDDKLNHAYDIVNHWAQNALDKNTTINGGLIQTNTITADKIAIGDFTNYCQLSKDNTYGSNYSETEGFDGKSPYAGYVFHGDMVKRDTRISGFFPCKKGDSFRITYKVKAQVKGQQNDGTNSTNLLPTIGIYTLKADGKTYSSYYNKKSQTFKYDTFGQAEVSEKITLTNDSDCYFYVNVNLDAFKNFGGWFTIIDPVVRKMNDGELIVDGAITGDKLAVNCISNSNFKDENYGTSGSWINLKKGTMNLGGKLTWDGSTLAVNGNITATSGRIADYTINGAMLVGNNVGLSGTSGQGWAFWAGSNDASSAPFRVGHDGSLVATTGTIAGWHINSNGIWQQNSFGNVSVTTGVGKIDAIGTSDIDFLRVQKSDGTYPFYVHKDGEMYCSKATISGTIDSGTINGGTITGSDIISTTMMWGSYGTIEAKDTTMANPSGIDGQGSNGLVIAGYLGSSVDIGIRRDSDNSTDDGKWDSAIHINGVSTVIRNPPGTAGTISSYIKLTHGNIVIDPSMPDDYARGEVTTHGNFHVEDGNLYANGMRNGNGLLSANIRFTSRSPYLEVLCANANTNYYGCDAWTSDARLKNTIKDTSIIATPIIKKMEFKQFNWNDSGAHVNIGLIAQDLEKIDPDLVIKIDQHDGSYMYQVSTTMMSTITAKAVQETISKVNTLESDMNLAISQTKSELEMKLMTENQKLKDKLAFLEEKVKYMNGEKSSYSEG